MNAVLPFRFPAFVLGLAVWCLPTSTGAQQTVDVPGSVIDVSTGQGIPDVVLRVQDTDVSAATDETGRFVLRGIPVGQWILRVDHLAYGTHRHEIAVDAGQLVELQIRLAAEAIELEPLIVEAQTSRQRAERAQGSSLNVVERPAIERALGTSKHMGDLIRQTVPGIRLRQTNNLAGTDICLEFRGAATISLVKRSACAHPMVLLDGVPVSDPNYLYGAVGLPNIERIRVIPPGEAGARYGTGSLYGVILIETRPPGRSGTPEDRPVVPLGLERGRMTFDWSQEPEGHPLGRAILGASLGNSLGLLAGVAAGQRCIGIDDKDQIVTSCGGAANAMSVLGAMALPAMGGALGVRLGGGTDGSVGRLLPALVGAGMMLFPGYAFSMSTVGGGSAAANAIGNTLLIVGPPLLLTVSDRLFRRTR
ncbi:MAG TPA: carboxypeptidase regulatory-like domain-containing protein [Longimicrobiales bacterium]|nr:carboxypeptidase regulatory-like domain-containing protein [Longimicrobiales bacterium]